MITTIEPLRLYILHAPIAEIISNFVLINSAFALLEQIEFHGTICNLLSSSLILSESLYKNKRNFNIRKQQQFQDRNVNVQLKLLNQYSLALF